MVYFPKINLKADLISYFYDKYIIFENDFWQKIEKNNNVGNEFLGINTHNNMIFKKKFFLQVAEVAIFSELSKKGLTT